MGLLRLLSPLGTARPRAAAGAAAAQAAAGWLADAISLRTSQAGRLRRHSPRGSRGQLSACVRLSRRQGIGAAICEAEDRLIDSNVGLQQGLSRIRRSTNLTSSKGALPAATVSTSRVTATLPVRSVLKIFCNAVPPSYTRPWGKLDGESYTGTGFAIAGRRILTNSHVVRHAQLLQVQRHDRPGKWPARLLADGVQCDLALLTVDDEAFWEGVPLQQLSREVPLLQHVVTAVGYPLGGDNLSVTRGVVSRIDLLDYTFLQYGKAERLLVLQIDAAINPGNSGGPVFDDEGKVVGVAFAGLNHADNIGYVIPLPVISLFLNVIDGGARFGQLPSLGVSFQETSNRALRRMLNLAEFSRKRTGLLVTAVSPLMPAKQLLANGDVVLAIDGCELGEDGSVASAHGVRLHWEHLVTSRPNHTRVTIDFLRNGESRSGEIELRPEARLVPFHHQVDASAEYAIVGGLAFFSLSVPLIEEGILDDMADAHTAGLLLAMVGEPLKEEGQQVVVLAKILESELTVGCEAACLGHQLESVNGTRVTNLRQLASLVLSASKIERFLHFKFKRGGVAVLETEAARRAEARVLAAHDVAHWCSAAVDPKRRTQSTPRFKALFSSNAGG